MTIDIDMNSKNISIILPVLNSEKYIEATLNSIFSQIYQNFELIVAYDEKSTDNTLSILQEFQKTHPFIIDIGNDTNTGAARNRGFRLAKGEFIVFIDADDIILPNYLSSMLGVFNKHPELDVVCCGVLFENDTHIQRALKIAEKSQNNIIIYGREEALLKKVADQLPWGVWSHMVRKSYLLENNLHLPDYTAREDLVYTLQLFMNTPKIGYSSKIVYIYLKHTDSITATRFDKWWDMCQPSRRDLEELSKYLPENVSYEIKLRDQRLATAGCACKYDYKTFLSKLELYDIQKLVPYSEGDTFIGKIAVIVFNISKYAYYKGFRYMKKCSRVKNTQE